MKLSNLIGRGAFAFAAAATLAMAPISAEAKDWRGWNIHVVDYPVSHGMEAFMAEVTEKTGGAIKGKTFHAGVLGSQPDAIEQIRLGVIDFGVFSPRCASFHPRCARV